MLSDGRRERDWGGLTKVSQLGGLGTNGTAGQRETRGCVAHGPMLTQQSGPFTVEAALIDSAQPQRSGDQPLK